ncbi:hypothetical protein [Demequina sp.]|uniref:hypothetical protein n=1 Tax=Demequina sp. TaxID=2050685 RepID=UPI003D140F4A
MAKRTDKAVPAGEHRWPAVAAVLVATALYATLPNLMHPAAHWGVVAICVLLLIPLIAINPVRLTNETALARGLSIAQALILFVANQASVVLLVIALVEPDPDSGARLLLSAAQVWATNVIAVALVLWEMDRGGPFKRWSNPRSAIPAADLRFSQDEDRDTDPEVRKASAFSSEDWRPQFFDYLYSSLSNAMAFSASDSMPLSLRAKALMGLEALSGFVILALVIARAVSLLG